MFVEGNADLTPAKLLGHHNPARVLRDDYRADNFQSDCVHNAGPDPRSNAARLPRLDASGEQDADVARDLARLGRGRLLRAAHYRDVAPALSSVFGL